MARRSRGEGAIYRDGTGYRGALWVTLPDGRRVEKKVRGPSRQAVSQKLEALKRAYAQHGGVAVDERLTLGAWLARYLEDKAPCVRASTYHQQTMILTRHLYPELGHLRLAQLTAAPLQQYLTRKLRAYSAGYVRQHYALLAEALRVATRWGYLARNPMEYVERPPQRPVRPAVVLDEVQAVALLRAARAERLGAVFALALTTTMRIGEILALRWEDLDLERRRVRVTRTLSRLGGRWLETEGKTAASRRTIDLAPWVVAWLRAHQARQAAERAQAATWVRPDLVFTSQYHPGAPVNSGVLRLYVLPRILRRAGLDVRMCLHDLRKTAISLYLRAGEDLKVVQRLAGHATPAMTLHVYRNLVGDEAREAVDRFAPRLDPDGTPRGADREPPNNLPVRSRRGAQLA